MPYGGGLFGGPMPGYVRIPNEALTALFDLGGATLMVYTALLSHRHSNSKECYPAIATIAKETHLSVSTVRRHIRDLEAAELIITVRRQGRGTMSNQYNFNYLGVSPVQGAPGHQRQGGVSLVTAPARSPVTAKQQRSEQEKAIAYCNKQGHGWTDLGDTLRCRRCGEEQPNNVIELQA